MTNCLPTMCNLQTKSAICPLCGIQRETSFHCLIQCLFAKNCWNIVWPDLSFDSFINIYTWVEYVLEHQRDRANLISTVCWGIWKARNEAVWNDKTPRAGFVLVYVTSAYLTQWKRVQVMGSANPTGPKPQRNCVKINCE